MNETEKKKIFIARVIIGSVAFIILILWAFNLKNVWQDSRNNNQASSTAWSSLKDDLGRTLGEAQVKLNQIKGDKAAAEKKAGDEFLSGLLEEAVKNASSSALTATSSAAVATSSPIFSATSTPSAGKIASSTKPTANCPQYIDCMPTIGAAKPCVVPSGCEGITLIAY
ncbi:MAG: hypothetical protein NTY31_02970 [Candidatus Falkowbacteria bacterium]|nr:hypothetical protein [Candidatus Falkowbacteria bacterium]